MANLMSHTKMFLLCLLVKAIKGLNKCKSWRNKLYRRPMCLVVVICIANYFQHKTIIKQSKQADIGIRIYKVINSVKERV